MLSKSGLMVLFALGGCAGSEAARQQDAVLMQQVRVSKSDPVGQCQEVGGVEGRSAWDYEGAIRGMRRKAYEKGANFVRIDTVVGTYLLSGVAFRCAAPPAN